MGIEMPGFDDHAKIPDTLPVVSLPEFEYADIEKDERIGTGGDADVYRATVESGGETHTIAVKTPRFEGTVSKQVVEQFENEAETWARLDDHENIVTVYAKGIEPIPWIALEYMDGGTLEGKLGNVDVEEALWLSGRIADGVHHGHRHGVAHLDIKPTNVLLRETGSETWDYPKVSDWGLAKMLLEHSNSIEGLSPQYAAPEQFDTDEYGSPDDITDIYQLGVVVYALLTGEPPFTGSSAAVMRGVLDEEPPLPSEVNPDVTTGVDDVVMKALNKEKDKRYESVVILRKELDSLFEEYVNGGVSDADSERTVAGASTASGSREGRNKTDRTEPTESERRKKTNDMSSKTGTQSSENREKERDFLSRRSAVASIIAATGAAGGFALYNMDTGDSNDEGTAQRGEPDGDTSDSGIFGGSEETSNLKIGVLQPLSGIVGYWGRMSTFGFISGLAYRYDQDPIPEQREGVSGNTVNPEDGGVVTFESEDRTYNLLLRDTELNAGTAQEAATDLVTNENVDVLFGCISSDATERVIQQVAKPTDTTYIVGASSSIATVGDPALCGRKIFHANEHTGMEARAEGRYIGQETDTETVYLLGPDNVFGRSFARMCRQALEENGVEVVGERFVPSGFSEFRGILEDIDDQAQGLGINFTADTLPNFLPTFVDGNVSGALDLRGYAAFPGRTAMNLIGNVLESELGEITEESIEQSNIGGLASRYHWNRYDNPINDDFVPAYVNAYGSVPDFFTSGSFAAASAIAQAVEETESEDPDDIADAMYGMTVEETPKGEGGYVFQEHNNQAKSEMTVAEIVPNEPGRWEEEFGPDDWNAPIMPSEPVARISADEVVLPEDSPEMNCNL